jgi:carbonic anhydrase
MISAQTALERLREGNERFVSGTALRNPADAHERRMELLENQNPFAVVLGCSDSRVPAEMVFDQGLGDLFVIRVAGNIVAPSQIGSIEFAADRSGVRLVVVMGHSGCGAVAASLEDIERPAGKGLHNIGFIVDRIKPGIEPLVRDHRDASREQLLALAVRQNIHVSVHALRKGSDLLEQLIASDGLMVVGAEYSLEPARWISSTALTKLLLLPIQRGGLTATPINTGKPLIIPRTQLLIVLSLVLCAAGTAGAQNSKLYTWTDENGVVHFSDTKPEGQAVQEQNLPIDDQPAAESPYAQDLNQPSAAQQRREEIARKNEEARAEQTAKEVECAAWQAEVDLLEPNRRVFFTNEKGETERMDDVERTDRVAELKDQIARNCR